MTIRWTINLVRRIFWGKPVVVWEALHHTHCCCELMWVDFDITTTPSDLWVNEFCCCYFIWIGILYPLDRRNFWFLPSSGWDPGGTTLRSGSCGWWTDHWGSLLGLGRRRPLLRSGALAYQNRMGGLGGDHSGSCCGGPVDRPLWYSSTLHSHANGELFFYNIEHHWTMDNNVRDNIE